MSKIKRLEKLLLSINSKKHFTLKELAQEFQVSTRTIQRDLLSLIEMGLPIVSEFGPHGGYKLEDDRILPPIGFTEKEASSILFNLQMFDDESFPFHIQNRSITKKLLQYLPDDAKDHWIQIQQRLFIQAPLPEKNPVVQIMLEAAIKQKIVTAVYTVNENRTYCNMQPIGIYSENGEWLCPAFCYTLMDFHIFKLKNISNAVINYEPMDVKDFSGITIHNWATQIESRNSVTLEIKIAKENLPYCVSHPVLKQYVCEDEAGDIFLRGPILKEQIERFAEYVWNFKDRIDIHSPSEILDYHREWAENILLKKLPILNM